jgi:plasmid stabilization system protein ParE
MRYQVQLTAKAEQDIEAILVWFQCEQALAAASRWYAQLLQKISTLEQHPHRCPIASEAVELGIEIRELLFGKRRGKYRLLFQIQQQTIYVLRVWHSARDRITLDELE